MDNDCIHNHKIFMSCRYCTETSNNAQLCIGQRAYNSQAFGTAFKILLPLASEGNVIAQCLIGSMFQLGLGTLQNFSQAKNWYILAGLKGCPMAFNNLATIGMIANEDKQLIDFYRDQAVRLGLEFYG